jgi:hypothetical protein
MKKRFLVYLVGPMLAALALASASAPARADGCAHADIVFYTTDTTRLATELSKAPSSCADYYLSITPTGTGAPRGGAVLTSLHAFGSRFHALAEIRLGVWSAYAATNGWFAAGLEARREMKAAGYDPALGDTWAVDEVGAPSGTQLGVDVLNGAGTARQDLRDFVRGLDLGDDGVADPGVVFAADPVQVTSDLSQYKASLQSWYADAAFWQDMGRHVRFWAQETYADARTWGVDGGTLAQRTAYLDDYFLHGARLAAGGDGATEAARVFFAGAYLPLGNASYQYPAPDPSTGIGFGATDVNPSVMQAFVSGQVYALRSASPARFGFAVVPKSAAPTDAVAVEDRVAGAIQSSDATPTAVCGTSGESCAGIVAGAAFNDAWKAFANTLEGSHVVVHVGPAVEVVFGTVTARGATQATSGPVARPAPKGFVRWPATLAYDVETTAAYGGTSIVCIAIAPAASRGHVPWLFRLGARGWVALRRATAPSAACGSTSSLGTFAAFAKRGKAARRR